MLERARQAPTFLNHLIFFYVALLRRFAADDFRVRVDLFAEAGRNQRVAKLVRDVVRTKTKGLTDLIARSTDSKSTRRADFSPMKSPK